MTTFPGSPKLLKAALVALKLPSLVPKVIPFQYNPITLSRSLEIQSSEGGGSTSEAMRLSGAPVESIKLEIELDACDRLERGDPISSKAGIYPQLAALETLLYPPSSLVIANEALLSRGTLQIVPPEGPFLLFVWGVQRVLPVRLTEFSVTEEAYDQNLNPIRAKGSLGLRVLSYNDLPVTSPGYHLFLSHQILKETQAKIAQFNSGASIPSNINIL